MKPKKKVTFRKPTVPGKIVHKNKKNSANADKVSRKAKHKKMEIE